MGGIDAVSSPTISIHPNVNISCGPAGTVWLTFTPDGLGRTHVRGAYLVPPDEYDRIVADGELELLEAAMEQLNSEDASAMVDLQRNTQTRYAEPGILNEREEALVHFYRYLAHRASPNGDNR